MEKDKRLKSSKKAEEGIRWCEKCDYCDNGTVFRHCLGCGKCFCEWHAGKWGYCYKCAKEQDKLRESLKMSKQEGLKSLLKDSVDLSTAKLPEIPKYRDKCSELWSEMDNLRRRHRELGEQLRECRKNLELCLTGHSEQEIEQGICDHWESAMSDIRDEQRRLYQRFLKLRTEYQKECT